MTRLFGPTAPRRLSWPGAIATIGLTWTLGATACDRTSQADTVAPVEADATAQAEPSPIDAEALRADLTFLADDRLAGRHTFSAELLQAADYLAKRYTTIGLQPLIGDDVRVPFSMFVGAKKTGDSALVVHAKRARTADAATFIPLAEGRGGKVKAQAVFVGYAAQADEVAAAPAPDPDDDDDAGEEEESAAKKGPRSRSLSTTVKSPETRPGYDDFAGVDLKGKVAVVLLDLPGRPDLGAFFERLQAIAKAYETEAKPLLDKAEKGEDTNAALAKLHRAKLDEIAGLVEPFLRGGEIPKAFFEPPETYEPQLDLQTRLAPLTALAASMPGPRFDPREGFLTRKLDALEKAGVAGVVLVRGPSTIMGDKNVVKLPPLDEKGSYGPPRDFPIVQVDWKAADKLFPVGKNKLSKVQAQIDEDFTPRSLALDYEIEIDAKIEPVTKDVPNLVGVIPGTDLADEYVLVGAHFDHIGKAGDGHDMCNAIDRRGEKDEICNGADDNASGSVSIVAIAQAIMARKAQGIAPRRTIVFMHFAGEELGLWGSQALADRPELDPSKVVAMINLDMVGRLGRKGLAIGGINSSPSWMPLLDELGTHGMKVLYEGAVAGRSDHASFYRKGIPVLFLFTGTHADYHRAGDDPEEVNFDGMLEITELGFEVIERVAGGLELPFVPPTEGDGIAPGLPGTNPDTVIKTVEAAP